MKRIFLLLILGIFLGACSKQPVEPTKEEKETQIQDYVTKAIQYLKEGDGNAAIRNFDAAIRLDPNNPQAYLVLGQVYMNMRDFNRAIDTFAAATQVAPDVAEAYYYMAMCYGFVGNREAAIANAQISAEKFRAVQDEGNFVKALSLLQGLVQAERASNEEVPAIEPSAPPAAQAGSQE